MKETRTVIPAAPGFDIVTLLHAPWEFTFTPVVAWLVVMPDDPDEMPSMLPLSADFSINEGHLILNILRQPNGTIAFVDGPTFAKGKEADALAHAVKQYEKQARIKSRTETAS